MSQAGTWSGCSAGPSANPLRRRTGHIRVIHRLPRLRGRSGALTCRAIETRLGRGGFGMPAWRAIRIDRFRPLRLWHAAIVVPVLGVALGAGTMAARSGAVDSEECEARLEQAVEAIST